MNNCVRFLADENFNKVVVKGLLRIQPAIDILTASDAGILGMPDPEVLVFAANESRVLVSHDVATMPTHFGNHIAQGMQSAGLILIPQELAINEAIEVLRIVWLASVQADWVDQIEFMP